MKVELSQEAFADMERLELWLSEKHPLAGGRVVDTLLRTIRSLQSFPERGVSLKGRGVRQLVASFGSGGYVIHYRVERERIFITRIHHARELR